MDHAVIVIGAGVAGCAAALEASRLGLEVLMVDPAPVAGAGSLARGTIPAAVLRETIVQTLAMQRLRRRSAPTAPLRLDPGELASARRRALRGHLSELSRRLASKGVRFERGRASLASPSEVFVEGRGPRRARAIVIATGTRARRPASFPFDGEVVCDDESILRLEQLPRQLVIVGAEVVGCEFACLFATLGVGVTLVDRRRRLLRCADREVLELLHRSLQQLGVVVTLEEEIEALEIEDGAEPHAVVTLGSGRVEKCDRLLVLAGREPEIAALGLGSAGVLTDAHGFIQVDEHCRTSQPGVYAVGDVVGYPFRAGTGMHQARIAMLHAAGCDTPPPSEPPIAIHTFPEISIAGLIEEAARRLDVPYGVGIARFRETLRGRIRGDTDGLVKLVFRREDRRLLGVQIIGEGATELVHLGAAWLESQATIDQVANFVFTHPSLAEVYRLAALDGLRAPGSPGSPSCPTLDTTGLSGSTEA